jgi:hypothetical protein
MTGYPVCDETLLNAPLWYIRLPGSGVCAAETADGSFLVLFTSAELAHDFIRREDVGAGQPLSPTLYSSTRAEFMARVESAVATGIRGLLVDLQADGHVREIIEFSALDIDSPSALRSLLGPGRTIN